MWIRPGGWPGKYRERIDVRVGLEVDFSPDHVRQCVDVVSTFDLDVVAGSVHFLDGENMVSRRSAWGRGELAGGRGLRQIPGHPPINAGL